MRTLFVCVDGFNHTADVKTILLGFRFCLNLLRQSFPFGFESIVLIGRHGKNMTNGFASLE